MRIWLWRIPWLILAACSLYLWSYRWHLELLTLTPIDPLALTRGLMANDNYAEAADQVQYFLDSVEDHEQRQALTALAAEIDSHRSSLSYQTQKIQDGLLTGSSDEVSGQLTGIVTSLLVIGDIRDLTLQGLHWVRDEPTDEVIIALATIGLVASAAQVVSVSSSSPVKTGIALIKQAHQLGALPRWLQDYLLPMAHRVLATRSLAPVMPIMQLMQTLLDQAGWRQALNLLGKTQDPGSLNRLVTLARHLGPATEPLVRLGGDAALAFAPQVEKWGIANLKLASRCGPEGIRNLAQLGPVRFIKYGARFAKWGYSYPWLATLAKYLLQVPSIVWAVGAIVGVLLGLPWPWRRLLLS